MVFFAIVEAPPVFLKVWFSHSASLRRAMSAFHSKEPLPALAKVGASIHSNISTFSERERILDLALPMEV